MDVVPVAASLNRVSRFFNRMIDAIATFLGIESLRFHASS